MFSEDVTNQPSHLPGLPEGEPQGGEDTTHERLSVPPWYRVGIIGAGAAGLRTAMLLQKLGIPYDILEASKRSGGRIFTYHFASDSKSPAGKHDYYEVGPMRFPNNDANKLTFDLFEELKLQDQLEDYVFSNPDAVKFYNGKKATVSAASGPGDHFDDVQGVDKKYIDMQATDLRGKTVYGVAACSSIAFDGFRKELLADYKKGWDALMQYDWASTRAYLSQYGPKFPLSVIQWMETQNGSTRGYDHALSEIVLSSLDFNDPSKDVEWKCIKKGTEVLAEAMVKSLIVKPKCNHQVTSIEGPILLTPNECFPNLSTTDREWQHNIAFPFMKVDVAGKGVQIYSHVVSTVPFSNLSMINTDKVKMSYAQRQAIRSLTYGSSVKIGIKFKSRWWEQNGQKMRGGSSYTDRPIRVVVYPSYGIGEDGPGVLIVSYTWSQDASRLGSLIKNPDWSEQLDPNRIRPESEELLLQRVYEDLSALHDIPVQQLKADTLDYHAFNWYNNPYTMGAYAFFGPGQFDTIYKSVIEPSARGRFHFAGEAASTHHAWIAGALDSAKRSVNEILQLDFPHYLPKFQEEHGISVAFSDEEQAKKQFIKGVFATELEEAEIRAARTA
ncbi:hypothetical protein CVT24_006311 [Panaeolus cyanescens]|uniref:Amine oxidase domain-containing protein n=1 Tax=Panaeolus cyanescens TaxID=181874 RepID=A0A409YEC8_9AGAR|nr:hypothetical protein CVT24_006311 [Panaeolus cyanescens]